MAISNLTTLAHAFVTQVSPVIADNLRRMTAPMFLFPWVAGTDDGKNLTWKVNYSGNTSAASYDESDSTPTAVAQGRLEATLAWKQNWVAVSVTGIAEAVSRAKGSLIGSAARGEMLLSIEDLQHAIADQVLSDGTGNSAKDITGIYAAIAEAGTYAGLARSSYAWWKAYVNDNSAVARDLSIGLMEDTKRVVEMYDGTQHYMAHIDLILAHPSQWDKYGNLLLADRRYTPADTMDGGFKALDFQGVPVVKTDGATDGRIDFLERKCWSYHYLPIAPDKNVEVEGEFGIRDDNSANDKDTKLIVHYSQVKCTDPSKQAALTDLST